LRKDEDLEERKLRILSTIIRTYIETGKPVASKMLVYRHRLKISPATVRNIMAELEELGYLTHPHTSAGRIPTDEGYRYYVDILMEEEKVSPSEKRKILTELLEEEWADLDRFLEKSVEVISELTDETALLFYAGAMNTILKKINLIPVSENKLLFIFISDTGDVHHVFIDSQNIFPKNKIVKFLQFINSELATDTIYNLKTKIKQRFLNPEYPFYSIFHDALELFLSALEKIEEHHVYFEGTSKVLMKPEFHNIERLRLLFSALERKRDLIKILKEDLNKEDINIRIGKENTYPFIKNCSIITVKYKIENRSLGVIGVLGPKRLAYGRVISILKYVANILGEVLETSLF
jgi:heat-inducible transcriptional repressor